jgi:hypothetical protein
MSAMAKPSVSGRLNETIAQFAPLKAIRLQATGNYFGER